jgi:prophage antirepressor-like protein
MSSLSVFDFEGNTVRFVGTVDKPEWVAQDVCKVLEIKNVSDAIERLDDYQKGSVVINDTSCSTRKTISVLTVTEAGLYALIFTSRKASAKRFQRWVFNEVLPSIRKTGTYTSQNQKLKQEQARIAGKYTRRSLTDAINSYVQRHPELPKKTKDYIYATTTDNTYKALFGVSSKVLKETRGVKNLRDNMTMAEINAIDTVEGIAQRLIDIEDVSPIRAMLIASERALLTRVFLGETAKAIIAFNDALALAEGD